MSYPLVPLLMGIILGPYLELYMRRSLITSNGDVMTFFSSPISIGLYAMTLLFIYFLRFKPPKAA